MQVHTNVSSNRGGGYHCFIQGSRSGVPLLHPMVVGGTCFIQGVVGSTLFHPRGWWGGNPVCSPVCSATQNSERFETATKVLPSVYIMAGPIKN